MPSLNISSMFGYVADAQVAGNDDRGICVAFEEYDLDRWIILYYDEDGEWEAYARYILFET